MPAERTMLIFHDRIPHSIACACLRKHPSIDGGPLCIFALPLNLSREVPCCFLTSMRSEIYELSSSTGIPLIEVELRPEQIEGLVSVPTDCTRFHCFILQTRSFEKVRDRIKKAAWPLSLEGAAAPTSGADEATQSEAFLDAFAEDEREAVIAQLASSAVHRPFSSLGVFWRSMSSARKAIMTHSFDHGGGHFYRFRLHREKLRLTPAPLGRLSDFLLSVVNDCPNHFFKRGPRVSARKWQFCPAASMAPHSALPRRAAEGIGGGRFKGAHDNVEVHCLEHDEATIAVEVPVWWERCEMGPFASSFPADGPLTGHIDLVRVKNGHVEIWDYKPDVEGARMVGMQVLIYAIAMAVRTGIPLRWFRCGYFDTESAWSFTPSTVQLKSL